MTSLAIPALTSAATPATTASSSGSANGTSSLSQADFLQLLTAQLKYQTPTSPADPTQLASEFASISTVDGIDQLNTKLQNLATGTGASQAGQAAALVGKQVAIAGNSLIPDTSNAAEGAFKLSSAAQNVNVTILDPSGAVAGSLNLGAMSAGQQSFSWNNGTAGTQYTYQVSAADATGAAVSVSPYSVYTVAGVNLSGTSPTLNIQGSATTLPVSSIQTVL